MASQRHLVEKLFEGALALKATERCAFLDEACNGNPELRRMVEDLLADDARAGSFLQHAPLEFLGVADENPHTKNGNASSGSAPAGRFSPGRVLLGRFVIVRFLAKGGMGEVYEAEDRFLHGAHVALKTILPHMADDPGLQERFAREVVLAREVIHPNLCPIYDIFHCDEQQSGCMFLTMKLLKGETLAERLKRRGAISLDEGLAILRQIVAGLAAIHAAGIVHRDIKPNNIMLDGTGPDVRLCITDFGLARALESELTVLNGGAVIGTPDYMAPELFLGQPPTQGTDLYALGVVLHEVFTGRKPTIAPDMSLVAVRQLNGSNLPLYCVQLIRHCLDRDPVRRCEAFKRAFDLLVPNSVRDGPIHGTSEVRRRSSFAGTTPTICVIGVGSWLEWEQFESLLHPLSLRSFVAPLSLPKTCDARMTPALTGVLGAIERELSRLDEFDRDLVESGSEDVNPDAQDPL
ncbi:serine/threonine protein kinase [Alloacidobacterium dinghuense]|uniref:Serine/threonine protein kinase n=1 Tax=Alloacidobacterium dinghuense TaxID=2763107 RepID=A0A7G8BGS0_9BACT|nr:serine/threonine-protein kinase [Alloacidobacterium dinghuense]QNI31740.1 serine/threonine protein kinase [Alloacidobacterium dinghuense]